MNLYQRERGFWSWYGQVMATLFTRRFIATGFVVVATAVARITSWLSVVLPLKVVLLAASDGVPRYFRFFIDPADKSLWIMGLTAGTIVLFIVTLILDAVSARVAKGASSVVVGQATSLALMQDQDVQAQNYYQRFCKVAAYGLFGFVALALLYLVNVALAGFLLGTMIAAYLYAAWVISSSDEINPSRSKAFVTDKLGAFLKIASSIAFLGGFLVLVIPFALGHDGNLIFAIAAILLSRQMLGTTADAVQSAVALEKQRFRINALVFSDQQLEEPEKRQTATFRKLFDKRSRRRIARQRLGDVAETVDACWDDASAGPVRFLVLSRTVPNAEPEYFQQQIYPPAQGYRLDNEELLFEYVARERLWAPRLVDRFREGAFTCQILECGTAEKVGDAWNSWDAPVLQHLWSIMPPEPLADAFRRAHRSLGQRFNERLLAGLGLGVDSQPEKETFHTLVSRLPEIRERLQALPHYIHNPELNRDTVVFSCQPGAVLLMVWGRWSLEPVGITLPSGCRDKDLAGWLAAAGEHRPELAKVGGTDALRLASKCHMIERLARRMRFKAALKEAKAVVSVLDGNARGSRDATAVGSG